MKITIVIVLVIIAILLLQFTDNGSATKNVKAIRRANNLRDQKKATEERDRKRELVRNLNQEEKSKRREAYLRRNNLRESDIPAGRKDGPSGLPMNHFVQHSSRKRAKEAAMTAGKGSKPVHDQPHDVGYLPHFHSTNKNGDRRKDGVHHAYPRQNRPVLIDIGVKLNKQARKELRSNSDSKKPSPP